MEGRAIDGTRASAGGRARTHTCTHSSPVHREESPENGDVYVCRRGNERGIRDEGRNGERGEKKAYQAKCARDLTRLDAVSRYETLRLPCALARARACFLSPYRGSSPPPPHFSLIPVPIFFFLSPRRYRLARDRALFHAFIPALSRCSLFQERFPAST